MSVRFKRLFVPFLISILGVILTKYWSVKTAPKIEEQNQNALAVLVNSSNEVRKKPKDRLVWFVVEDGDSLYPGETVRTSANAEAKITLATGQSEIEMDPDSEISLDFEQGKVSLDFLKGNLTVSSENASDELVVKAGDKKISLKESVFKMAKSKSGKLDYKVLKGKAELSSNGQVESLKAVEVEKIELTLLAPANQESVAVMPVISDLVDFQWTPIIDDYEVSLQTTKDKSSFKNAWTSKPQSGAQGKLTAAAKEGRFFWRLKATRKDQTVPPVFSEVREIEFVASKPVQLVLPKDQEVLRPSELPLQIQFSWVNSSSLENLQWQLAKEASFNESIRTQSLQEALQLTEKLLAPGVYFWRVSGQLKNSEHVLFSRTFSFSVKPEVKLLPPVLTAPIPDFLTTHKNFKKNSLQLQWQPVLSATSYKVVVQLQKDKRNPSSQEKGDPTFKRKADHALGKSPVHALEKKTDQTLRNFSWERTTTNPEILITDLQPGKYRWHVVALNEDLQLAQESDERFFELEAPIPLPAPKFERASNMDFLASNRGHIKVLWSRVPEAKTYRVKLKDPAGKEKIINVNSASLELKSLLPGSYSVSVAAVDEEGLVGFESGSKKIQVPDMSDLKAPKLKKVEVR